MRYFKDANDKVYGYDATQIPSHGLVEITDQEKNALIAQKRQNAFNVLSYAEKRLSEYPPIEDYIDGVVKGDKSQIDAYIAACIAVKAKYPKA